MKRIGTFIENSASAGSWGSEWVDKAQAIIRTLNGVYYLTPVGLKPFTYPSDTDYANPCGNPRHRQRTIFNDGNSRIETIYVINGQKTIYCLENDEVVKINVFIEKDSSGKTTVYHEIDRLKTIVDEYYAVPLSCYCIHRDGTISSHGNKDGENFNNSNSAKEWIMKYLPNCPFFFA